MVVERVVVVQERVDDGAEGDRLGAEQDGCLLRPAATLASTALAASRPRARGPAPRSRPARRRRDGTSSGRASATSTIAAPS